MHTPKNACYVATDVGSPPLLGRYKLPDGTCFFDYCILSSAKIDYNSISGQTSLYIDDKLKYFLTNPDKYIKPLKDSGVAVLLSISGNHTGAGVCNFPDQAHATAFAAILADTVTKYGLNGIDFCDEGSDYGIDGAGPLNAASFPYLVQGVQANLDDSWITMSFVGPSTLYMSNGGLFVGEFIGACWSGLYGGYSVPPTQINNPIVLAAAAVDLAGSVDTAVALAAQTVTDGYGAIVYRNMPNEDYSAYLSNISQVLYGQKTVYTE